MPTFYFADPTGAMHTIEGPEGSTKEQAFERLQDRLQSGKQPEQMGMAGSIFTGLVGDPVTALRQKYGHLTKSPQEAAKIDAAVNAREQQLQQAGIDPVGRMIGQAPVPMAATAAGTALTRSPVAGGAIGGAVGGALQPVTNQGNFWGQTESDLLWGSTFGAGGTAAVKGLGTMLSGVTDPAKRALIESGVKLTHGQILGGVARRAEEAFKSFPILGSFIRGAEGKGIEGFNRAVINQSLEPFGQRLPDGIPAGNAAVKATKQLFNNAYDKALQGTKLSIDADLSQRLTDIRATAGELGENLEKQFNTILDNRLGTLLKPGSNVPVKQAASDIREFADQYRRSGSASERLMARKFDEVQRALTAAVARQNPAQAATLRNIDRGYAMFMRVQAAAARRATSEGVFTPADLLQSIKSLDKSKGHSSFATGDSLLQVYAQYGQKVLPGKLPDSGTTERAMWDAAGLVWAQKHPYLAAGVGAASAAYTDPAISAANVLARGVARPVGSVVRRAAPYVGTAAAGYQGQPTPDEPEYGGPQQ